MHNLSTKTALVIGASRNLGAGLVRELSVRGWDAIGTVRGSGPTELHELAASSNGRIGIEHVDVTDDRDIERLSRRIGDARLDLLFVNAGITDPDEPVGNVSAETFTRVMVTNALAPMHVVESLARCVTPRGTIGVMTSRQGSIGLNTRGGHEVYRASKSALNQLMRSYAARDRSERTLLLIHPGWVQTELGGEGAQLSVAESVHGVATVIESHSGEGGLQFRDHQDRVVPW